MRQLIRAFRSQPGEPFAYAVLSLVDLEAGTAFRPSIRVTLNRRYARSGQRPHVGLWNLLPVVSDALDGRCGLEISSQTIRDSADGDITEGVIAIHPEGLSWHDLVDALAPRDPSAERVLAEAFELPSVC